MLEKEKEYKSLTNNKMRTKIKILSISILAIVAIMAVGVFGIDATVSFLFGASSTIVYATIPGVAGPAAGVAEGGLTSEDLGDAGLLDNDLDRLIVKVRPTDFPLDTLTRELKNIVGVKRNECGGYEVGTRDIEDTVVEAYTGESDVINLKVGKKLMWQKSDTIFVPGILGGDGNPLMLYIGSKDSTASTLQVVAANPISGGLIPPIPANTELIRLSKAMSETDAQTEAFSALPSARFNFTQIHMAQVEESVLAGLQKKVVNFDFSTQKEQTIWEMRRGMEFTNIFGSKGIVTDPVSGKKIYTSAGTWNQITNELEYDSLVDPTNKTFTALCRQIFDGNNGSDRRLLMAGSGFVEWLAQVPNYSKQVEAKNVEVIQGVKVLRVITDFGELLVRPMTNLFIGTMSDNAMVLDMSYIVKYVLEPLQTKDLDLDSSGQRRVKAQRLHENYALFLENLAVHHRIVKK